MNWFIVLLVYFTSTAVTAGRILLTQPDAEYRHYVDPSGRITYNVVVNPTPAEFVEKPSKYTSKVLPRTALPNGQVQRRGNLAQFDPNLFADLVVTQIPTYVYNAKNSQKKPTKFIPTDNEPQYTLPEVVRLSDLIRLSGPNEYRFLKRAGGIKRGYKVEYQGKLSSRRKRSAEDDDGEPPEEDVDAAPASDALNQLEDPWLGEGEEASEKDVNWLGEEEISEPIDDIEAQANENEVNDAESQDDAPKDQQLSDGADIEVETNNDAENHEGDTTDPKLSGGADIEVEAANNDAENQEEDTTDPKLSGGADIEVEADSDAEGQEEDDTTDQKLSDGAEIEAEAYSDAENQEGDGTTDQKLSGGDDIEAEADSDAEGQEEDTTDQKLSGGADIEDEAYSDAENQEEEDTADQKLSGGADIEDEVIEPRSYGLQVKVDTGIEGDRKEVTAALEPVVVNAEVNGDEKAELIGELDQAEPEDTGDDLEALEGEAEPNDNEDEEQATLEEEPETDDTNKMQSSDSESTVGTEQGEDKVASLPHDEEESVYEEPITGFEEESEAGQANEVAPSVLESTSGSEPEKDGPASMQQNKGESIDKELTTVLDEEPETGHNERESTVEGATTVLDEEPEIGEGSSEEASTELDEKPEDDALEEKEAEKLTLSIEDFGDEPQGILTPTLGPRSVDSDETMKNIDEKYSSDAGTHDKDKEELRMLNNVTVAPVTYLPVTETTSVPITSEPEPRTVRTTNVPVTTTQQPVVEMPDKLAHRYDQIKNDYTETVSNNVKNYIQARSVIAENLPPAIPDVPRPTPPSYVNEQRIALLRFQECIRTRSMGQAPCSLSAFLAEEYAKATTPGGLIP